MNMLLPSFQESVFANQSPIFWVGKTGIYRTTVYIINNYHKSIDVCFPFWKWVIFPTILAFDMLV